MSKNDDACPATNLISSPAAESPGSRAGQTAPPTDQAPETPETLEPSSNPSISSNEASVAPDHPQSVAVFDERNDVSQSLESFPRRERFTWDEFHDSLGIKDLPMTVQLLLFAAPVAPVDLIDRCVDIDDIEAWLARFDPFIDDRLVYAAGWLSDLLVMEMALRPAQSRDELRTRIMILADSRADRPENGHYDLVCETVLRADIARLGLPADDPVVTHFESRMTLKTSRKSEG